MTTDTLQPTCFPLDEISYHADKSAWNKTMLADFRKRRRVCYETHIAKTAPPEDASRVMDIGDLAHAALLEPHKFATNYIAFPSHVLAKNGAESTNASKDFRAEHEAIGITVLKQKDFDGVARMVESVQKSFGKWFSAEAQIEHVIYWTDPATGLRCKIRPDLLAIRPTSATILDVKTTRDVSPREFQKRVESFAYWLQDSHYSAGVEEFCDIRPTFVFVAVETEWPHASAVYELSPRDKVESVIAREKLLNDVADCTQSGDWSDSWENQVNTLTLKPWAYE